MQNGMRIFWVLCLLSQPNSFLPLLRPVSMPCSQYCSLSFANTWQCVSLTVVCECFWMVYACMLYLCLFLTILVHAWFGWPISLLYCMLECIVVISHIWWWLHTHWTQISRPIYLILMMSKGERWAWPNLKSCLICLVQVDSSHSCFSFLCDLHKILTLSILALAYLALLTTTDHLVCHHQKGKTCWLN